MLVCTILPATDLVPSFLPFIDQGFRQGTYFSLNWVVRDHGCSSSLSPSRSTVQTWAFWMGIKGLHQVLANIEHPISLKWLENLRVAIDGHGWLHRCGQSALKRHGPDTTTEADVLRHAESFFAKAIQKMIDHRITVTLVFDGQTLPLKAEKRRNEDATAAKQGQRKHRNRIFPVLPSLVAKLTAVLEARFSQVGLTVIRAPYEADSQLAFLYRHKIVDAVVSEDFDLLAYGVGHLVSKVEMNAVTSTICGNMLEMRYLPFCNWGDFSRWTGGMFLTFCILCGCDYLERLPQLGPRTAYNLVSQYGENIQEILKTRQGVPASYFRDFRRARLTFRHAVVKNVHEVGAPLVHLTPVSDADLPGIGEYLGKMPVNAAHYLNPRKRALARLGEPEPSESSIVSAETPTRLRQKLTLRKSMGSASSIAHQL